MSKAADASRSDLRLADLPEQAGRTTASLLASLTARLQVLHVVSGAAAVGSLVSGFAALGREASKTADGERMRRALSVARLSANGTLLWSELRLEEWVDVSPPAPLLSHLGNDLALLLADDLEQTLELLPIPTEPTGVRADDEDTRRDTKERFLDCMVGMWAWSREMQRAIELLAAPNRIAAGGTETGGEVRQPLVGRLLR